MEYFDSYILVILKMLRYYNEAKTVRTKQISIILGPTFVLSFQEMKGGMYSISCVIVYRPERAGSGG